jgi:acetyl-CoA C-acetyltransferase
MEQLNIDREKLNVHGGAISLGHPLGCSGTRILVTLMNAMVLKNIELGCASICLGGGEAISIIIKRKL